MRIWMWLRSRQAAVRAWCAEVWAEELEEAVVIEVLERQARLHAEDPATGKCRKCRIKACPPRVEALALLGLATGLDEVERRAR